MSELDTWKQLFSDAREECIALRAELAKSDAKHKKWMTLHAKWLSEDSVQLAAAREEIRVLKLHSSAIKLNPPAAADACPICGEADCEAYHDTNHPPAAEETKP